MATFTELQTIVQTQVIDLPTAVRSAIPRLVVQAIKDIQAQHNFRCMSTLLEVTTDVESVDHFLIARPANWKEANGTPYFFPALGTARPMLWASDRRAVSLDFADDDDGQPAYLAIGEPDDDDNADILLWPVPDGTSDYDDGEYRVRIPYYRYLPDLSAASDSNWFTVNCVDYITWQAAGSAFMMDWGNDQAAAAFQLASGYRAAAIKRDRSQRFQGATTLAINTNGARRG